MDTIATILLGFTALVAIIWIGPKLLRGWWAEKTHHKYLEEDRKNKEANYPD